MSLKSYSVGCVMVRFFWLSVAVLGFSSVAVAQSDTLWQYLYPVATSVDGSDLILIEDRSESLQKRVATVAQVLESQVQIAPLTISTPTEDDEYLMFKAARAMTVVQADCITVGGTSADLDVLVCAADGTDCSPLAAGAAVTCDDDGADDGGDMAGLTIGEDAWVKLIVGAVVGEVSQASLVIRYR